MGSKTENHVGRVYNRWTVIEEIVGRKSPKFARLWLCRCKCGKEKILDTYSFKSGSSKSCGCLRNESASKTGKNRAKNYAGKQFGKLLVLKKLKSRKNNGNIVWECKCSCGKITNLPTSELGSYGTKSCGCLRRRIGNLNPKWEGYGEIGKTHWKRIIEGARTRDLKFDLSIKYIWELFVRQGGICKLSGRKIAFSNKTASLDRIDSSKGYTTDNIQWVHKDVNRMKQEFDEKYFIDFCKDIVNYERR
jgi:hypothetical protein